MYALKAFTTIRNETIDIMYECYTLAREEKCPETSQQYIDLAKHYEEVIAKIDSIIKVEAELCRLRK